MARLVAVVAAMVAVGALMAAQESSPPVGAAQVGATGEGPKAARIWKNSPLGDPNFFPLTVWLQDPKKADQYRAIGINMYIGIWQGPKEQDLAEFKKAGMPVICDQNQVALRHLADPIIVGWMHGDEPDNAQDIKAWKSAEEIKRAWPDAPNQPLEKWGTYGPPIPPSRIIADYQRIKQNDPTRPVMLNLGQGVAYEKYNGRGYRAGHLEDYPEYVKGCDLVSFDIYPVVHDKPEVRGKLEMVPLGVDRLRKWSQDKKLVWNCIECTHISNPRAKATPYQVRAEIWMSLIHGSRGLIYFVHQFEDAGKFIEAALLEDQEMSAAVGRINRQITELAPVLNSPTLKDAAAVASSGADVPIDILVKKHGGATYIFAVAMRDGAAKASFSVKGLAGKAVAEVLGENRKLDVADGEFADNFKGYEVHLYKIAATK